MNFEKMVSDLAYSSLLNSNLKDHGWDHTLRVVDYSKMIALDLGINLNDILVAAYFHDTGRIQDGADWGHAKRSYKILSGLISKLDVDSKSVLFAVKYHSDMRPPSGEFPVISNYDIPEDINPLIAACLWDADRLDLIRVPKFETVDINYLSTDFAKNFANSKEHLMRYVPNLE